MSFQETVFLHNKYSDYLEDITYMSILKYQVSLKNLQLNLHHTLNISFKDVTFFGNQLPLSVADLGGFQGFHGNPL